MQNGLVRLAVEEGVGHIELSNPPANAYSVEMMRDLDQAILEARFDDDCHVVLLTGAGEKFFCAGADIGMLQAVTPRFKYQFCLHANETMLRIENTSKLVIAALQGHCVGGGLEIALAADLRVAAEGSGKLGLPEVALGVLPGTGGTQRLARMLGKAKAIELMCEGTLVDYDRAAELGLVNHVWDADGFLDRAKEYARSFCPPLKASMAVGHIKRAVQAGAEMSLENGLALERELQQRLFESEDAKEGLAAFNDKRKPEFRGR
ncbi:MAG: enoyl-CoA hydratase [Sandaracinaceae bacterium]|nr:MAG: enoyl-CoA hydratase/isomerase family protein [Sandaracinaceae bacterium]HBQ17235.1 enoyl-CoA hydratase [Myxococcales bacterium]